MHAIRPFGLVVPSDCRSCEPSEEGGTTKKLNCSMKGQLTNSKASARGAFLFLLPSFLWFLAVEAQQDVASSTVTGVPLAGRLTHVTTASTNSDAASATYQALGLTSGPFPNGWVSETLPKPVPDGQPYTSIGFWLGNMAVEVVDWNGNVGFPDSWITFEPASDAIAATLNSTLSGRGFDIEVDATPGEFTRFTVVDFPSNNASSEVQYTYTPAYSFLPMDYTAAALEPQGTTLGLLDIREVVWSTVQTNVSQAADAWSNLLNVPWEDCTGNGTIGARCFPPTNSYGMAGPAFTVVEGTFEGFGTVVARVVNLNLTASALTKALGNDGITEADLRAGMMVNVGGVFFRFQEDPSWYYVFESECPTNATFAALWPKQCRYALYGTTAEVGPTDSPANSPTDSPTGSSRAHIVTLSIGGGWRFLWWGLAAALWRF